MKDMNKINQTAFVRSAKERIINAPDKRPVASLTEELVAAVLPGVTMASGHTRGSGCTTHDVEYGNKIGDVKLMVPHCRGNHERVNHCDKYRPDFVAYVRINEEDNSIAIYDTIDNEVATHVLTDRDTITFNAGLKPNHKATIQNENTQVINSCRVTII
tara:strand:- start:499 stop:975 length:477 start_codon:yes stop_codon:yes gene_type:complete